MALKTNHTCKSSFYDFPISQSHEKIIKQIHTQVVWTFFYYWNHKYFSCGAITNIFVNIKILNQWEINKLFQIIVKNVYHKMYDWKIFFSFLFLELRNARGGSDSKETEIFGNFYVESTFNEQSFLEIMESILFLEEHCIFFLRDLYKIVTKIPKNLRP